jgi:hypothetical protein
VDQPPDEDPEDPFRLRSDPGWRPSVHGGRPDGLIGLRLVFIQMVAALAVVGAIVVILSGDIDGSVSGWVAGAVVVAVGIVGLLFVRFAPVRLDCSDELALARSYRSRFFARMAASELPALAGFIGFVVTGRPALYPIGLVFTAIGLAAAGPMHANLVRDQERLAIDGCPVSLVPALRHPVTRDRR